MTGGKRLRIAALFVIVLVFAFIMDMSSNAITDNTLIRNDTGDGDAVYDLVLNADGLDEDYSYQLKVMEEQPSDKQGRSDRIRSEMPDTAGEWTRLTERAAGSAWLRLREEPDGGKKPQRRKQARGRCRKTEKYGSKGEYKWSE